MPPPQDLIVSTSPSTGTFEASPPVRSSARSRSGSFFKVEDLPVGIVVTRSSSGQRWLGDASVTQGYSGLLTLKRPPRDAAVQERVIKDLQRRIERLEQAIQFVDELDWDDALNLARQYFDQNPDKPTTPDVLAEVLGTSVSQAADLCEELEREGLVAAPR